MKKVELYIIPYAKENEIKTGLIVDGNRIDSKDNRLTNLVVYQPMRKWLNSYKKKLFVWEGLLAEIIEEFNDKSIHFVFHGCKTDYMLFKKSIVAQQIKMNRNGGDITVDFEIIDKWNPKKTMEELDEILDDLRLEADNWGEDDIIKEIDHLKSDIINCEVMLEINYLSDISNFKNKLELHHIIMKDEAAVTIIPVEESISVAAIEEYISAIIEKNEKDRKCIVVNTSMQTNEELFDVVNSFDNGSDGNIKYIENDGDDYLEEIKKIYYSSLLPCLVQRVSKIVLMYPDCNTNSYLLDISDRINNLLYIVL